MSAERPCTPGWPHDRLGGDLTVTAWGSRHADHRRRHLGPTRRPGRGQGGAAPGHRARINFIDTADSYGPHVSEELNRRDLVPVPG